MKNWNEFRDGPWEATDDMLVSKIHVGWIDHLIRLATITMYGLAIAFLLTH